MKKNKISTQRTKIDDGLFAYTYARVSTKKQFDNNCSIETQMKYIFDYATRNNIEIVHSYGLTFESAKTDDRKEFNKMISDAKRNRKINTILVFDLDRFSRSGGGAIVLKDELLSEGIYLHSVTQPIDTSTDSGVLMQDIHFIMGKYDNMQRKKKCLTGIKDKLEKGECTFTTFGYSKIRETVNNKETSRIVINEQGFSLKKAFEWKAYDNLANSEILFKLRSEERLNLEKQQLSKIFRNPYYKGYIRHKMLGDKLVKAINFEALVSEDLFDLANGIVTSQKYAYRHERINDKYPLKRHVFCAECGEALTAYTAKQRFVYYKCNTIGCCKNYSGEMIHNQYSNMLRSYSIPNEFKPVLSCVMKDLFYDWNKLAINQQKQFKTRITEIENKVQTAKVKYGCGEIEKDIYDAVSSEFIPQLNDLKQKLEIAEINLSNYEPYVDYALQMSCKLGGLWNDFDIVKKEKLQNLVFPEGVFYDQKIKGYRTPKHNSFLHLINTEIASYKNEKSDKKKINSICRFECG